MDGLSWLTVFKDFGFPALLVAYLIYQGRQERTETLKGHAAERQEWQVVTKAMFDRLDNRQAETNECIRDMTAAIQAANERCRRYPKEDA